MNLRFYMDHHVSSAITEGLRQRGVDCLTASEDRHQRAEDTDLLHRSTDLGRVLVSFDVDLLGISHDRQRTRREFAGLIFGRQLHMTIGDAIGDLELIAVAMSVEEIRSRVVYVPL